MSTIVRTEYLRRELALRGWLNADLARAAGLSDPTITAALAGRPISPRTLKRIAFALSKTAPIPGIEELLAD